MFPGNRGLLFVALVFGMAAFHSSGAHAITVTLAEVQGGDAVVSGRKAAANQPIIWEDEAVTVSSKNGRFSFQGAVPLDCVGILSDGSETIDVELANCPEDPGEPPPQLILQALQVDAHSGDEVRAVGFNGGKDSTLVFPRGPV
jgi:hypothetical protein